MRKELAGVRRADRCTVLLSARPRPGNEEARTEGCACRSAEIEMPRSTWELQKNLEHVLNLSKQHKKVLFVLAPVIPLFLLRPSAVFADFSSFEMDFKNY